MGNKYGNADVKSLDLENHIFIMLNQSLVFNFIFLYIFESLYI